MITKEVTLGAQVSQLPSFRQSPAVSNCFSGSADFIS